MPIRRLSGGSASRVIRAVSRPKRAIRPRVGRSAIWISFKRLVLPAPDAPVRKWKDPASSTKFKSRSTSGAWP